MGAETNRRGNRDDRRRRDAGPPKGCCERRKSAERRLPLVEETALADDEFMALFGSVNAAPNPKNDYLLDQSAEVFSRVRDGY